MAENFLFQNQPLQFHNDHYDKECDWSPDQGFGSASGSIQYPSDTYDFGRQYSSLSGQTHDSVSYQNMVPMTAVTACMTAHNMAPMISRQQSDSSEPYDHLRHLGHLGDHLGDPYLPLHQLSSETRYAELNVPKYVETNQI